MITLEKLAGYTDNVVIDKVAEAMDYLEANGIDPIGGLTALMNVDEEGNPTDEKVASELNKLAAQQINILSEVAEYLADENPEEIAKVALDINQNAMMIDKVAETMDYLEANGIDPKSALIIAANVTPEGTFTDEKVASEVAEAGFTNEDFTKIAEAIEYLGENGVNLEDAIATASFLKEAGISEMTGNALGKIKGLGVSALSKAKGLGKNYKDAITGAGAKEIKKIIKSMEAAGAPGAKRELAKGKGMLRSIRARQAKAIGGTALGVGAVGGAGYLATKKKK